MATTTLLMPILAAAAIGAGTDPRFVYDTGSYECFLCLYAARSHSPNVITFATGRFSIKTMVREGIVLNLVGVIVISAACVLLLNQL